MENNFKLENTCRACTKNESELVSVYDKQNGPDGLCYSDMIAVCTMYTIEEDDALPQFICSECTIKVRNAYEFKKLFEESQKKLLALAVEYIKKVEVEPVEDPFEGVNDENSITSSRKSTRNLNSKPTDYSGKNKSKADQINVNNQDKASHGKQRQHKCPICAKQFVRMGYMKNHMNRFHKEVDDIPEVETIEKVIVKSGTAEFVVSTIKEVVNEPMPESDAEDFDCGSDNDEDAINCPETESIELFKAELDISDSKIDLEKISEEVIAEETNQKSQDDILRKSKNKKPRENYETGERRFQCETCNKSFKRNSHLKQHLLCHTKLKPFECTICHKKFGRTDNLRVHMSNHGKKQFECDSCGRSFAQLYLLKRHKEQTHSEEKPFLCSECGQRFVRNGDLAVHMRRHTGEKPYKCQYCNKGFTRSTEVYVHERYHTGEKKHVCNICGKAFQRPYNLLVHVRTHTGERPYQCPHCPKNFAQCSDLKAHIRRHTGERFKCDKCSMGFIHAFVLNQHKRNVHGIEVPPRLVRIAKLNKEALNTHSVKTNCNSSQSGE